MSINWLLQLTICSIVSCLMRTTVEYETKEESNWAGLSTTEEKFIWLTLITGLYLTCEECNETM